MLPINKEHLKSNFVLFKRRQPERQRLTGWEAVYSAFKGELSDEQSNLPWELNEGKDRSLSAATDGLQVNERCKAVKYKRSGCSTKMVVGWKSPGKEPSLYWVRLSIAEELPCSSHSDRISADNSSEMIIQILEYECGQMFPSFLG